MIADEYPSPAADALRVELEEGYAECMGDGLFIVFQTEDHETTSIVLSREDMEKMLISGM